MATTTGLLTEPQEVADHIQELLDIQSGEIGLARVANSDKLVSRYPAAIVQPGIKAKNVHGTHTFNVGLEVLVTVYHARLDNSHESRTREDLDLCTAIENTIELGEMNFDGRVIFAYVREITPGIAVRAKGEQVVASRMVIEILSQKRFPYAT